MFSNLRSKEEKEKIARKKEDLEEEEEATMLKKRLFAPTTQDDPTGQILKKIGIIQAIDCEHQQKIVTNVN